MTGFNTDGDGRKNVEWLKIKWLKFHKSQPNIIKFKYDLLEHTVFHKSDIIYRPFRSRSSRKTTIDESVHVESEEGL